MIPRGWGLSEDGAAIRSRDATLIPVRCADGTAAMLKIMRPGQGAASEATALSAFGGRAAVRLLHAEPARGLLLVERLIPGTKLRMLSEAGQDAAATRIAGRLIAALPAPVPEGAVLADAAGWGRAIARASVLPAPLRQRAESAIAGFGLSCLLHGDLHHDNILRDGDGWRAVDPKGLIGPPALECGALLRNPIPWLVRQDIGAVCAARIAILAEATGLPPGQIAAAGLFHAACGAGWAEEDGEDPRPWAAVAAALLPLV